MSRTISVAVDQTGASSGRGRARSHEVTVDRPEGKGGTDRGAMGGELLLLGLGGCFLSNLLAAARARDLELSSIRVRVDGTIGESPERFTRFRLTVSGDFPEGADPRKLVTIAERACLVANTLSAVAPVEVELA